MEKERSRRKSRRKPSSKVAGFLYRQGRRWCAVCLSVCMIISNMAGTVFAAEGEEGRDYLFKLNRSALYEALQAAVLEGSPLDAEFIFQGDEKVTEEYEKLLAMNDDLYELKPEIKNNHGALTLRILASLDWGTEEGKEYRIVGNEKFIFLLTNHAETEQKAVIQVDNQRSEIIIVAPKQDFNLTEENLPGNENPEESPEGTEGIEEIVPEGSEAQEAGSVISGGSGGSGGGAGGGSGSGGGSGAGSSIEEGKESIEEGTGSEEVTEAGTENKAGTEMEAGEEPGTGAGRETGIGSENGTGKENGEGTEAGTGSETGTKAAEDTGVGGREENSEVSDKEGGNRENGSGQGNEAEKETGAKTDTDVNTDIKTDTKTDTDTDTEVKDNTKTEKDTDTKTEENTGTKTENNTEKTETGNTGSQEKKESSNQENSGSSEKTDSNDKSGESGNSSGEKSGESGNKDSGDSGNGGSSKENHNDEKKDTALSISSKNVQMVAASLEESEVTLFNASPSNASPSDASSSNAEEKMLEGMVQGSILMNEEAVAMFVTTAKDLGLDQEMFNSLRIYETETEAVTVRVGAKPGVLPADAELRVTELEEEGEHAEAYQEAKEALDKEGMQYEQMMALDISFYDHDGNEIEPDGDVRVSIKLNPEKIPEEVLPETMSVQHLQEEKNGEVQVIQVADTEDKTKGSVAVNDEETIAEFDVESFSTFTITWSGDFKYKNKPFQLQIRYLLAEQTETGLKIGEVPDGEIQDKSIMLTNASNEAEKTVTFNSEFVSKNTPGLLTNYDFVGAYYAEARTEEQTTWDINDLKAIKKVYVSGNQKELKYNDSVQFNKNDVSATDEAYIYKNIYLIYAPKADYVYNINCSQIENPEPKKRYTISVHYLYVDENGIVEQISLSGYPDSLKDKSLKRPDWNFEKTGDNNAFKELETDEHKKQLKNAGLEYLGAYYGGKESDNDWKLEEIEGVYVSGLASHHLKYILMGKDYGVDCEEGKSIYLVYAKPIDATPGSGGTDPGDTPSILKQEIWRSKTVVRNEEDGTYDLNLSINAPDQEIMQSKLNILFVVDTSSSMTDKVTITDPSGNKVEKMRIDIAHDAMQQLLNSFNESGIDVRYSMVNFCRYSGNKVIGKTEYAKIFPWGSKADDLINYLIKDNTHSGTNYQAGIKYAKEQLVAQDRNARPVVIYLTDGRPTSYGNGEVGVTDARDICLKQAEREIKDLDCSEIYFIGCGEANEKNLETLKNAAVKVADTNKEVYMSQDADLGDVFQRIKNQIQKNVEYTAVAVEDYFSEYAEIISAETFADLRVEVREVERKADIVVVDKDKNSGNEGKPKGTLLTPTVIKPTEKITTGFETIVSVNDGGKDISITAGYSEEKKDGETLRKLYMNFPTDYKLNPNYAYTLTIKIKPTEKVYQFYSDNGYPEDKSGASIKGEDYTGTHTNEKGFRSNKEAVVNYQDGSMKEDGTPEEKSVPFQHPVIQLDIAKVQIQKTLKQGTIFAPDTPDITFTLSPAEKITTAEGDVFKKRTGTPIILDAPINDEWRLNGSDKIGSFMLNDLEGGYYILHEVQPAQYKAPLDKIIHVSYKKLVDGAPESTEQKVIWDLCMYYCDAKVNQEQTEWTVIAETEWTQSAGKELVFDLPIENIPEAAAVLPDTGGPGLAMFERFGWFLLMMALMMAGMEVRFYGERKNRKAVLAQQEEPEYGDDW